MLGQLKKFDAALKVKDLNKLNVPEIDILRYRAQAEYLAGDYAAADHTYTCSARSMATRQNIRICE